ncbi:PTS glucitol/sorbitol transporter subunit IIA [Streptomyces sp. HC44]|uniref:PTS glucitol/sorbitol transporter subunit IIA n=1 Tax=Streptomyces scabichelini TaxID=2711217 RepID=A0A6G4V215_9ACTN|nr:PTS glucitol/sorbitol transporter subunit IIA [Streptomyces scabichelini]NGO08092.1 PTS glucitol/sorbitol transporter subunit IIA [Streptomyces scabichelini]
MNAPYYQSTILRVGNEAADLIDGGVLILFGEPLPGDLESLSVVHKPVDTPAQEIRPGDELWLGETRLTLTAVGERAQENLTTLGHMVVYVAPDPVAGLLPGAVHAEGPLAAPEPGAELRLVRA